MQHGESKLPEGFRPRVPVAGTLKIGSVEVRAGKSVPKKLDHLRFCGPSATASGQYPDRSDMAEENKAHLRAYTIELVSDDPEVNLDVAYVMAGRGHVLCRGNGSQAERRADAKGVLSPDLPFRPVVAGECGEDCAFFRQGKCKLASTLRFRIPEKTDMGAVWQFRTTSWNTAQDLLGAMHTLKGLTGGVLARIPLKLSMTEQRRNPLTDNGRTSSSFWTLALSFEGDESALIEAVKRAREIKARMESLRIPSLETRLAAQGNNLLREDFASSEERAVAAEFFPDGKNQPQAATDEPVAEASLLTGGEAPTPAPIAVEQPPAAPLDEAVPVAPHPGRGTAALTKNQESLIRRHAGRVPKLDQGLLDQKLTTMTKLEASGFITRLLTNAEDAFESLGVVAA